MGFGFKAGTFPRTDHICCDTDQQLHLNNKQTPVVLANIPIVGKRTCITCTDRATQTDGKVLPGGIIANEDALKYRTFFTC